MTPCSKHIGVKYHFFKEYVCSGHIQIHKVTSNEQVADCMTKGLKKTLFKQTRKMLVGWQRILIGAFQNKIFCWSFVLPVVFRIMQLSSERGCCS